VQAFDFYQDFVVSSAKNSQEGEKIDVVSFNFDEAWRGEPTEFEATFIHGGALYQYGFAVDAERVWSEWLFSKPNASDTKTRTLFQREYDAGADSYAWQISKTYVKGAKETWKKSTRDNALFLSTAVQLKAETFGEPFDWIQNLLKVVDAPERRSSGFTAQKIVEEGWKKKVLDVLQAVDIRIKDIKIETEEFDAEKQLSPDIFSEKLRNEIAKRSDELKLFRVTSYHQDTNGKMVPLQFSEESDGSRMVFNIAGPWLDVLEHGDTLVIDELHNSLHPHALRFLVSMFHDPVVNKKNAQLIFTSHETSVMGKGFMHQDQVWLVEKDEAESSILIPLSDYKVRDISSFQKAYLDGRYGAVPKLREFVHG